MYYARDFVKAKDDPEEKDAHDLVFQPDTVDEFTITYSKVFLGLNLACISCHDGARASGESELIYWRAGNAEEFFGQAAFSLARRGRLCKPGERLPGEYRVHRGRPAGSDDNTKVTSIVRVPKHGGNGAPRFILDGSAPKAGSNLRDELARMVTGSRQFSRAFTNRIFAEFMGFGLCETVDEFDLAWSDPKQPATSAVDNSADNPELLEAMAKDFEANHYSFKHFVKTLMLSSAYQLSSRFEGEWKPEYASYYARKYVRMLSAGE
jgi:hypothetical protein